MLKTLATVAVVLALTATGAAACLQLHSVVRDQELALLTTGVATFKLSTTQLAKARSLRRREEALYKARKFHHAMDLRGQALAAIGYTSSNAGPPAIGAPPPVSTLPPKVTQPVPRGVARIAAEPDTLGCGTAPLWTAPKPA